MGAKTLYLSELSTLGAVDVLVKSDVQLSQYKDRPKNVIIVLNGEERRLNLDNQDCEDAMTGLAGKRVTIEAHGSREEATITVSQNGAPAARYKNQQGNQRAPQSEPQSDSPRKITDQDREDLLKAGWLKARKAGNLLALCCVEAYEVARKVSERTGGECSFSVDNVQKLGVTLFIEAKGYVDVSNLPINMPEPKAKTAPAQQPPARKPAPKPPVDPDLEAEELDDIPF